MGRHLMPKGLKGIHLFGVFGIGTAGLLVYLASKSAGPIPLTTYTELRNNPLMEHLVTKEELGLAPARPRIAYPTAVAPGLASIIGTYGGFAPTYYISDRQAMGMPAEQPW
jgi:hypothetical protein